MMYLSFSNLYKICTVFKIIELVLYHNNNVLTYEIPTSSSVIKSLAIKATGEYKKTPEYDDIKLLTDCNPKLKL